jgi:hypothetical protein
MYMVTAALKFASDEKSPAIYPSQDDAKLAILKTLNWWEAHDEYQWPDFSRMNFDFAQAMRLRRALVNDVFSVLQKAGNVKIGIAGIPNSLAEVRRNKRSDDDGEYITRL